MKSVKHYVLAKFFRRFIRSNSRESLIDTLKILLRQLELLSEQSVKSDCPFWISVTQSQTEDKIRRIIDREVKNKLLLDSLANCFAQTILNTQDAESYCSGFHEKRKELLESEALRHSLSGRAQWETTYDFERDRKIARTFGLFIKRLFQIFIILVIATYGLLSMFGRELSAVAQDAIAKRAEHASFISMYMKTSLNFLSETLWHLTGPLSIVISVLAFYKLYRTSLSVNRRSPSAKPFVVALKIAFFVCWSVVVAALSEFDVSFLKASLLGFTVSTVCFLPLLLVVHFKQALMKLIALTRDALLFVWNVVLKFPTEMLEETTADLAEEILYSIRTRRLNSTFDR